MTVVPYLYYVRSLPYTGDRREDPWIYTPTPDGFERFMRVSVGLAADQPEATPVNQTRGTIGDPPVRHARRPTG
jgi:hypothetical protein